MATCRECLHYEVCAEWAEDIFGKDNEFPYEEETGERLCEHYTPKSDYVKRERGEWKVNEFPKQNAKFLMCSNCSAVIDCNVIYIDENEFDFCPYCSADMRKDG